MLKMYIQYCAKEKKAPHILFKQYQYVSAINLSHSFFIQIYQGSACSNNEFQVTGRGNSMSIQHQILDCNTMVLFFLSKHSSMSPIFLFGF